MLQEILRRKTKYIIVNLDIYTILHLLYLVHNATLSIQLKLIHLS